MNKKICSKCNKEKPYDEFYKRTGAKDGLQMWCIECKLVAANGYHYKHRGEDEYIERRKIHGKNYRQKYPDRKKAKDKAYRENNKEKESKRHKKAERELRLQMIQAYGGKCQCCGETRYEFLTLEHINGNGAEERRKKGSSGNRALMRRLRLEGWPKDEHTVLCMNCNFSRGKYSYCPHQREEEVV